MTTKITIESLIEAITDAHDRGLKSGQIAAALATWLHRLAGQTLTLDGWSDPESRRAIANRLSQMADEITINIAQQPIESTRERS